MQLPVAAGVVLILPLRPWPWSLAPFQPFVLNHLLLPLHSAVLLQQRLVPFAGLSGSLSSDAQRPPNDLMQEMATQHKKKLQI